MKPPGRLVAIIPTFRQIRAQEITHSGTTLIPSLAKEQPLMPTGALVDGRLKPDSVIFATDFAPGSYPASLYVRAMAPCPVLTIPGRSLQ